MSADRDQIIVTRSSIFHDQRLRIADLHAVMELAVEPGCDFCQERAQPHRLCGQSAFRGIGQVTIGPLGFPDMEHVYARPDRARQRQSVFERCPGAWGKSTGTRILRILNMCLPLFSEWREQRGNGHRVVRSSTLQPGIQLEPLADSTKETKARNLPVCPRGIAQTLRRSCGSMGRRVQRLRAWRLRGRQPGRCPLTKECVSSI
jgi:hypothetical protein